MFRFFTIDVASYIGRQADEKNILDFLSDAEKYSDEVKIKGREFSFRTSKSQIKEIAEKYLFAAVKAKEIYNKIKNVKGSGNFITEVSMDEVAQPQTPQSSFSFLKCLLLKTYLFRL